MYPRAISSTLITSSSSPLTAGGPYQYFVVFISALLWSAVECECTAHTRTCNGKEHQFVKLQFHLHRLIHIDI